MAGVGVGDWHFMGGGRVTVAGRARLTVGLLPSCWRRNTAHPSPRSRQVVMKRPGVPWTTLLGQRLGGGSREEGAPPGSL